MPDKEPIFLNDRKFAELIKNAPLVSIDLIIRDQEDRVLLQFREGRPAKGWWFVPGGRIRKYECVQDAIKRIAKDEIPEINIIPEKCHLLNIYKHEYPKDNRYADDSSMPDMKDVDTHYVSIAYEYITGPDNSKPAGVNLRWFTIHQLLYWYSLVHKNTKKFFSEKFHTPNDSELYGALMSHYIHYDSQFWSRTQLILAIQVAALAGAYATSFNWFGPIIMFSATVLVGMVWCLIWLDIKNSRVNQDAMDKIAKRLFLYWGSERPISLRAKPPYEWLTGRKLIHSTISLLLLFNLLFGFYLLVNLIMGTPISF